MVRGRLTPFRVAALAVALLLAQTAALVHSDFDETHAANEVCALCVGLATLGAGNVAAAHDFDLVDQRDERSDDAPVLGLARRADHRLARGPPLTS